ncbi:secreted protein containing Sulphatase-modifying factor domain protein [Candidatus Thiomargarita nelsonii]|uniref:Secreted protein containing Sulphatase-modifying factor domain protein n=1 Tax=Candidatus Thiomargarita nelsonii TaxID=1003181 RepID=A0A0A6NYB9_9GAMM|nr:secreted protein containing Sulphatase-modifying factor domain protein [Candidatus Thiomargarita nelsonii]
MKETPLLKTLLVVVAMLLTTSLYAADFTNFIGMKFKKIPAGSFYMGSCNSNSKDAKRRSFMGLPPACPSGAATDSKAYDHETPQHKVRITKSFYMGVYEVTLGQFKKFIAGANRYDLLTDNFIKYNRHGDDAAVVEVSWHDAQAFINWLNENKPRSDQGRYRLPTEAEWEYTARAGTTTRYSFGDSASRLGQYAWYEKSAVDMGENYPHRVGQKRPNPWGLYDMHGNAWEWVQDWYSESYYRGSPSHNPKGPSSGSDRVIRGGGWGSAARYCRAADRHVDSPGARDDRMGFRLLRQP